VVKEREDVREGGGVVRKGCLMGVKGRWKASVFQGGASNIGVPHSVEYRSHISRNEVGRSPKEYQYRRG